MRSIFRSIFKTLGIICLYLASHSFYSWAGLPLTPSNYASPSKPGPQDSASEVARLTARLNSADEEQRRDAALMLAALQTPEAAPALKSALADKSERVRAVAVTGLAQFNDPSLVPVLANILRRDKSVFVRKSAAYALGALRSQEATPALVSALKNKDAEIRGAAAVALGQYPDASAIEPLINSLSDKSEFVQAQAAHALGVNGRAATIAVPKLISMLNTDKANGVRRQAATALGKIGDRSALPALRRAQLDPDPYLRLVVLDAIKIIESPAADS